MTKPESQQSRDAREAAWFAQIEALEERVPPDGSDPITLSSLDRKLTHQADLLSPNLYRKYSLAPVSAQSDDAEVVGLQLLVVGCGQVAAGLVVVLDLGKSVGAGEIGTIAGAGPGSWP